MKTALDKILDYKVEEVRKLKLSRSSSSLERAASVAAPSRPFLDRMRTIAESGDNALICELKRKSPSAGEINPGADPIKIAQSYERGGAACLSVLTDGPSFGGSLDDLEKVKRSVSIPILRKDFMIDVVQVLEARAHGADCILVIMAAVDDALALDLHEAAHDLGMSVLVEVHDQPELERALKLSSPLLGVNNRNLKTMTTDLSVTEVLAKDLPDNKMLISESGVHREDDVSRLRKSGARGFLIGESLMRSDGPESNVRRLVKMR